MYVGKCVSVRMCKCECARARFFVLCVYVCVHVCVCVRACVRACVRTYGMFECCFVHLQYLFSSSDCYGFVVVVDNVQRSESSQLLTEYSAIYELLLYSNALLNVIQEEIILAKF